MAIFDSAFVVILQFMAAAVTLGVAVGSLAISVFQNQDRRPARRVMFIHIPPHYPLGRGR